MQGPQGNGIEDWLLLGHGVLGGEGRLEHWEGDENVLGLESSYCWKIVSILKKKATTELYTLQKQILYGIISQEVV